jgi:hypothetical protein
MRFLNKFLMFSLLASPLFLISEARSDLGKFAQCDARYPFNKAKRNECKKAVDKKRDVKKEVKANGGSNKDARQAGRAAKNEHMAQTNLFNAKSTARKQARADKLNTKVDCRLAGNHSNSECRKLGREAKLNTKADSGAYNFARTNRMKARAGGLGAQVDCLKNGGDKKSCRHIKRGERNRLKGEGRLAKFNQLNGVPSEQGYESVPGFGSASGGVIAAVNGVCPPGYLMGPSGGCHSSNDPSNTHGKTVIINNHYGAQQGGMGSYGGRAIGIGDYNRNQGPSHLMNDPRYRAHYESQGYQITPPTQQGGQRSPANFGGQPIQYGGDY